MAGYGDFFSGLAQGYGFVDDAARNRESDEATRYERARKRAADSRMDRIYGLEPDGQAQAPGAALPAPGLAPVQPQGQPAGRVDADAQMLGNLDAMQRRAAAVGGPEGFQAQSALLKLAQEQRERVRANALNDARRRAALGDYSGFAQAYRLISDGGELHEIAPIEGGRLRVKVSGPDGQPHERELSKSEFDSMIDAVFDPAAARRVEQARALEAYKAELELRKERAREAGKAVVVPEGGRLVQGGQVVAEGNPKASADRPVALSPGQALYAPDGRQLASVPDRPSVLSAGQVAYGPGGRVIARGPDKPAGDAGGHWMHDKSNNRLIHTKTGETRALPAGAAAPAAATPDRTALGGELGVPVASVDPSANVTDPKARDKMRDSLYTNATKQLDKEKEAVDSEAALEAQVRQFLELQSKAGGFQQGPIAGRAPAVTSTAQTMDAITNAIVPKMREPGSGTTSDKDLQVFRSATLSREKTDEANSAIAQGLLARAQGAKDRLQFMRDYLSVNGHLDGADREWKRYVDANPIFDPSAKSPRLNAARKSYRDFFAGGKAGGGKTISTADLEATVRDAAARGKSREQVMEALRARGYSVQ